MLLMKDLAKFHNKNEFVEHLKASGIVNVGTYMSKNIPLEARFQSEIIKAVKRWEQDGRIGKCYLWKSGASAFGNRIGLPDVMFVVDGKLFAVEVKRPFIGVPSDAQLATIKEINASGGCAFIASFPQTVENALRECGVWHNE